jgi:hypothetical protein
MKISTILDHIDSGHMALPEFQRGYVWNRDQVRGLFDSLYRRHPVGGLLVWATESKGAVHRGELSQHVAVLLNESAETLALASRAGFRCFTQVEEFRDYVGKEVLSETPM